MKTLIIHPQDSSTDFLKPIYAQLSDVTVITKNTSREQVHKLISSHDQIIMLGHGSPNGLFNVSSIGTGTYAIGGADVELLRNKQLVAVWCNSDQFIKRHQLTNVLYSGMFISEVSEAEYCNVQGDQAMVDESNNVFAALLGRMLGEMPTDLKTIHSMVGESYEELGEVNAVAKYNSDRWYYNPVTQRKWEGMAEPIVKYV